MLGPDDQRTLVQSLAPPTGFTVDVAVGTTYSLDLVAALTVPTAFLRAAEAMDPAGPSGDDAPETPLALLTAVRSFADRITIFTDASRILVPEQRLGESFAFLDQMVVPVPAPEHGSFHPKVWVIR